MSSYKSRYSDEVVTQVANLVLRQDSKETKRQKNDFLINPGRGRLHIEFSLDFLSTNEYFKQGILCYEWVNDKIGSPGILWVTNYRILYVSGSQLREYSNHFAAPVNFLVTGRIFKNALIQLFISTNLASGDAHKTTYNCLYYPHDVIENFVRFLNNEIEQLKQKKLQDDLAKKATIASDFIGEIERLGTMQQQGLITEEEFKLAKNKLLKG